MSKGEKGRPFLIVLMEDSVADIYLVRQALEGVGLNFELTVIEDGAEARAYARRDGKYAGHPVPDLTVLDLNLPRVGGLEVLDALRRNDELSQVPVAILTSSAAPSDRNKATSLGIQRFISKPVELDDFLQIGEVLKQILEDGD